jgi:hypothetical protein
MTAHSEMNSFSRCGAFPEDRLQEVLHFVKSLRPPERPGSSVEEKPGAIVGEQSQDTWGAVHADGAERHDHYIYCRTQAGS